MEIRAVDNFLCEDDFKEVIEYCKGATYLYGAVDDDGHENDETFCVGMTHLIYPNYPFDNRCVPIKDRIKIFDLLFKECKSQFPEINEYNLTRMYVNCFSPRENPYFHIDSVNENTKSYTCLLYVNDIWDFNDGGETQFYINDIIYGILPIPNRMILFDGRIKHKATTFRNKYRFTIALKYEDPLS